MGSGRGAVLILSGNVVLITFLFVLADISVQVPTFHTEMKGEDGHLLVDQTYHFYI